MPRREYEWRRVTQWPNGDVVPSFPTGELQAREDYAIAPELTRTRRQGATVVLQRRRVLPWEDIASVVVLPEVDTSSASQG